MLSDLLDGSAFDSRVCIFLRTEQNTDILDFRRLLVLDRNCSERIVFVNRIEQRKDALALVYRSNYIVENFLGIKFILYGNSGCNSGTTWIAPIGVILKIYPGNIATNGNIRIDSVAQVTECPVPWRIMVHSVCHAHVGTGYSTDIEFKS